MTKDKQMYYKTCKNNVYKKDLAKSIPPKFTWAGVENAGKVPMVDEDGYISKFATPGGGGGTSDYQALENLPILNGHKIIGDKNSTDYDLVSASVQTPINEELTNKIANKQDKLTAGNNIVIDKNNVISAQSSVNDVRCNGRSIVDDGIANLKIYSPNETVSLLFSDETLKVDSALAKYNTSDDGLILTFSKSSDILNIKHDKFSVGSAIYNGIFITSLLASGDFVVPGIFKINSLDISNNLVSNSLTITPVYDDYQKEIIKTRIELKDSPTTTAVRSTIDVRNVFNLNDGYFSTSKADIDNYTCIIDNNNLYWNFEAGLKTSFGSVGSKLIAKSINTTFTDSQKQKWKVDVNTSPTTWSYRTGEILWGTGSGSNLVWLPLSTEYKFEPSTSSPLLSIYIANTGNTTGTTSYLRCCLKVPLTKVS